MFKVLLIWVAVGTYLMLVAWANLNAYPCEAQGGNDYGEGGRS